MLYLIQKLPFFFALCSVFLDILHQLFQPDKPQLPEEAECIVNLQDAHTCTMTLFA